MVLGIFTFPLFILEEASRITIWGTWQAKEDMYILKEGVKVVRDISEISKVINNTGGRLHPIAHLSYREACNSLDFWVLSATTKILAVNPKVMDGETVSFLFSPETIDQTPDGPVLVNRQIRVLNSGNILKESIRVYGPAHWTGTHLEVRNTLGPSSVNLDKGGDYIGTEPIP
jgi:hypothetical protein